MHGNSKQEKIQAWIKRMAGEAIDQQIATRLRWDLKIGLTADVAARQTCSPEQPMPKGATGRWAHTRVKEIDSNYDETAACYQCLDCGHTWWQELPQ